MQEELALGNDGSTISLQRVQTREQIDREIDIVCELQHENIVRFIGSGQCCAFLYYTYLSEHLRDH